MCVETNQSAQSLEPLITILGEVKSAPEYEVEVPLYQDSHLFQDESFREFIQKEFPDFKGDLVSTQLPTISDFPDELERWEVEQIRKRKARKPQLESELQYLSRLLYEEFFSVNQNPDRRPALLFKDIAGMTPGGLISHFYSRNTINGASVENTVLTAPKGNSLGDAAAMEPDFRQRNRLIDIAVECTWQIRVGEQSLNRPPTGRVQRQLERGLPYPAVIDSIGFRLIRMLVETPEMLEPVKDIELRKIVNPRYPDRPISKVDYVSRLWEHCQPLLTEYGTFADPKILEVKKILQDLLFARTHPELQIFFLYFSPSGFINEKLTGSK